MVHENQPACFCGLREPNFDIPTSQGESRARSFYLQSPPHTNSPSSSFLQPFASLPSSHVTRAFVSSKPLGHPSALSCVFAHRARRFACHVCVASVHIRERSISCVQPLASCGLSIRPFGQHSLCIDCLRDRRVP